MPELPEVETTRRGIEPHILKQTIANVNIREHRLRWPILKNLKQLLSNQSIRKVSRRGKYLLLECQTGTIIIHLGMSGRLCVAPKNTPAEKHDHIDIEFNNGKILRFTDPRKFGCVLWTDKKASEHKLLKNLGPEPLSKNFNLSYLFEKAKNRKTNIKNFIMNSQIVVGVGNIYANEALFKSGISPQTATNETSKEQLSVLIREIKKVLTAAIKRGGTTLKDYYGADGKKGFFALSLYVYGRSGEPCKKCKTTLKETHINQRSTVYCPHCQR